MVSSYGMLQLILGIVNFIAIELGIHPSMFIHGRV